MHVCRVSDWDTTDGYLGSHEWHNYGIYLLLDLFTALSSALLWS